MKILSAIFWFMLGGTVAVYVVNKLVIGGSISNLTTPGELAVYNLHDQMLPYFIFFAVSASLALLVILVMTRVRKPKKYDEKK